MQRPLAHAWPVQLVALADADGPVQLSKSPRSLEECVVAAEVGSHRAGGPCVIDVQCQQVSEAARHSLGAETVN